MKEKNVFVAVSVALALNLVFGFFAYADETAKKGGDDNVLKKIGTIMQVLQLIRKNYVDIDKVSTTELLQGALQGMTDKLDPHSTYLPPVDFKALVEDSEGEFGGIGVTVHVVDNHLLVVSVMKDAPGAKAGIIAGDKIVSVDGKKIDQTDIDAAVLRLRGKPGTKVKVGLLRTAPDAAPENIEVEVTRAMIPLPSVTDAHVIDDSSIGYVRLIQFMEPTAAKLEEALKDFEKQKVTAIIMDLRNNPGGLLESAIDVCSLFLPKDSLVVTVKRHSDTHENRESENFKEHFSRDGYKVPDKTKLVILVNGGSASASEITAGCLRDHKRAILLGEKTYGKGSVQNVVDLGDGSAVKLTIARYYTPDPKRPTIDGNGVEPDITEKISTEDKIRLIRKLANEGRDDVKDDPQLARAVEVLKSLSVLGKNADSKTR